jgi:hypothetical protein
MSILAEENLRCLYHHGMVMVGLLFSEIVMFMPFKKVGREEEE